MPMPIDLYVLCLYYPFAEIQFFISTFVYVFIFINLLIYDIYHDGWHLSCSFNYSISPLSRLCGFHTDFLSILIQRRIIFNDTRN